MISILDTIDINYIVSHIKDLSGTTYGICFTKLFLAFSTKYVLLKQFVCKSCFSTSLTHIGSLVNNTSFSQLSSFYQTFFLYSFSFTDEVVHRTETKKTLVNLSCTK
jgi:hypothetical protein